MKATAEVVPPTPMIPNIEVSITMSPAEASALYDLLGLDETIPSACRSICGGNLANTADAFLALSRALRNPIRSAIRKARVGQ